MDPTQIESFKNAKIVGIVIRAVGIVIRLNLLLGPILLDVYPNKNHRLIDSQLDILVEGHKRGNLFGRAMNDKIVYIDFDGETEINYGEIIGVNITESSPWSLRGIPVT